MDRTNTNYDRQFKSNIPPSDYYLKGTDSKISPFNDAPRSINVPRRSSSTNNVQQNVRGFDLTTLPTLSEVNDGQYTFADSLVQHGVQTPGENRRDMLMSNIRELRQKEDIFRIARLKNIINKNNERLETDPNLTEEELRDIEQQNRSAELDIGSYESDMSDRQVKIEENQPDLIYKIKAQQMQEDEATGMPFGPSDYNMFAGLRNYMNYELPQDLAGTMTTAWATAASVAPGVLSAVAYKALVAAGTPLPGARWVATGILVAGMGGAMFAQYKAREKESRMESGAAYEEKYNELVKQYYMDNGTRPTGKELANIEMAAYDGVEQVYDANMMLFAEDVLQTSLLAIPWSGLVRTAFGITKYGAAAAGMAGLAVDTWLEGKEEGYQHILTDQYQKGTIPDDTANIGYWWDTSTETAKAMFGIGNPDYMNDKEFRNSVRAGMAMGFLMGSPTSVYGSYDSIRKYSKDEKVIDDLLTLELDTEQENYRQSIYSKAYNNGTESRTLGILKNLKNSEYAKDNNITNEDIDREINIAKQAFANYKYINKGKLKDELTELEKQKIASNLNLAGQRIVKAKENIQEHNNAIDEKYSDINDILSTKESEFVDLNRTKNRITAINTKLDKIKENKDLSLEEFNAYKKYLQVKLTEEVNKLEEGLKNSKLKENELALPIDEDIVHLEAQKLDNEYEIKNNEETYSFLSKPSNILNNIKEHRKRQEIFQEEQKKKDIEDAKILDQQSGITKVKDNKGNKYVYAGREGDNYTFLNQETKQLETLTKEQVDEQGLVEETTGQAITKKPTLLIDNEADEYLFLGKSDDEFKLQGLDNGEIVILPIQEINKLGIHDINNTNPEDWVPGSVIDLLNETNEDYKQFKAKLEEAKKDIDATIKEFKDRETERIKNEVFGENPVEDLKKFAENYGSIELSKLNFLGLFETNPVYKIIPIIRNTTIGYLELGDEGFIKFIDSHGTSTSIGNIKTLSLPVKDYGITVLKNFIFNFDIGLTGDVFTIEDTSYMVNQKDAFKSIKEDKDGNPISITLTRTSDNKNITFTNKTVVEELAAAIAIISEARVEILDKQKVDGGDFMKVTLPDSVKEWYVYEKDGTWVVVNPSNKKPLKEGAKSKEVLAKFHKEAQLNTARFEDVIKGLNQLNELTKTNIRDELTKIDNGIRAASAEEINNAKSAAELQDVEDKKAEETGQTDESEELGEKAEDLLTIEKAEEMAEEKVEEELDNVNSEDLLDIEYAPQEILNVDEGAGYPGSDYLEVTSGILDVASAVGWTSNEDKIFDDYFSNKKLSVEGWTGKYRIDYGSTPDVIKWWNEHPEIKEKLQNGELIDLTAQSEDEFDSVVDQLPVEQILRDKDGNIVPGDTKFSHRSDYPNIFIPDDIGEDSVGEYRLKHMRHVRAYRNMVITALMEGNDVVISEFERHKGVTNNEDKDNPDRNKPVFKVWPDIKHYNLGIGNINHRISMADGKVMVNSKGRRFNAPTGALFLETDQTLNGEIFALKLNVEKLSKDHAKILFKAMMTAYAIGSGGYSSVYPGTEVNGLNVGEVIEYLVLEGEGFTRQKDRNHPKGYLLSKQLYGKDNKIYYGENETEINPSSYTDKEEKEFIDWAKEHKNYNTVEKKLGTKFKKDFKIGSIVGKKNQRYDDFIIFNSLAKTDLKVKNPFHAAVLSYGKTEIITKEKTESEKIVKDLKEKSEKQKELDKIEKETKEEIESLNDSKDIKELDDKIAELESNKESMESELNKEIEDIKSRPIFGESNIISKEEITDTNIKFPAVIEETGENKIVDTKASEAIDDINERLKILDKLINCIK